MNGKLENIRKPPDIINHALIFDRSGFHHAKPRQNTTIKLNENETISLSRNLYAVACFYGNAPTVSYT